MKMRAMVAHGDGSPMQLVHLPVPEPSENEVLIKVLACGVCHGDAKSIMGKGNHYPIIPGHEVIGVVKKIGKNVTKWQIDDRVGIGWHGFNNNINGLTTDGGFAEYMITSEKSLVKIPWSLSSLEAAPLMCAGETTFSAIANSSAQPGDTVVIYGIGGLGHLAIQYAANAGYNVIAVSRTSEKKKLAYHLGANHFFSQQEDDVSGLIKKNGGAHLILVTAANSLINKDLLYTLVPYGEIVFIGGSNKALCLSPNDILAGPYKLSGYYTGKAPSIQQAVNFSELVNIKPMIEIFPLEQANEAFQRLMQGKVLFRPVLEIDFHET